MRIGFAQVDQGRLFFSVLQVSGAEDFTGKGHTIAYVFGSLFKRDA